MKKRVALIVVIFALFIVLVFLVKNNFLIKFDTNLLDQGLKIGNKDPNFWILITKIGEKEIILFCLILASIVFLFFKKPLEILALTASSGFALLLTDFLKNLFQFERPSPDLWLYNTSGFSMPSGHTLQSTAFFLTLCFLILPFIKKKWLKNIFLGSILIIIILVGVSRVVLGVHFPSDVLGGFLIGLLISQIILVLISIVYPRLFRTNKKPLYN